MLAPTSAGNGAGSGAAEVEGAADVFGAEEVVGADDADVVAVAVADVVAVAVDEVEVLGVVLLDAGACGPWKSVQVSVRKVLPLIVTLSACGVTV